MLPSTPLVATRYLLKELQTAMAVYIGVRFVSTGSRVRESDPLAERGEAVSSEGRKLQRRRCAENRPPRK